MRPIIGAVAVLLCSCAPKAPAGCEEEAAFATFVSIYCPSNTDPQALGRYLALVAKQRAAATKSGQAHIIVVSAKGAGPKNADQIDYRAPTTLATIDWNNNSRFYELMCRREPDAPLTKCIDLL